MAKSETMQVRIDPDDLRCLRNRSEAAGMKVSDYVRHLIEPAVVAERIAEIASDYSFITKVVMFGSMARGDHGKDSDLDIAIQTDGPYRWMGECGMGRFVGRLEEAVGRGVDVVKSKNCSTELAAQIERDGRLVYERQA